MRKQTIYRLSIRLTERDMDLLWLEADPLSQRLSALAKQVLKDEISGQHGTIPLPRKPTGIIKTKTIGIRFYKNEDEEIADWIQQFKKGNRGLVIKELLRHSMEQFDYRAYADSAVLLAEKTKREQQNLWSRGKRMSATENKEPRREELPESTVTDEAEEDWLSGFEEMAKQ